ncbi:tRNA (adenosine(37)-N6)-threonylcarbamoyltransferase complex transferase subunit TsaD [Buchnera aphidicola]|uniref:tRNA N6-adenosine threonylcarbamoyltransferase n=1 Tax=Buchnera aphidicola (Stegophylla sp.) TaxID=2315800 RepID=A0A4D6YE07_9GAMM|nr:tRNA (adenosine(37)-N6)-threonylcarbamoyltransferase complex transferase subunit TsaD [Buchnera aphidicola (Stegophylla sp.)]QCI26243.1 tRNA (adenosine(37)-N6)-threonylcarbamoyltransferase complex transferase subunit TsaD [Buchnera aphidicola (Stegophylla sp.)]
MRILGIETSFDDTGVAIYDSQFGILINELCSQTHIHNEHGGVLPELASREHLNTLASLIQYTLNKVKISLNDIDGIAYTAGPGLSGTLLIGATLSFSLSFSCNIPIIPIHHMEGHLLTPMIENNYLSFPFIGLLISGKHTQLIYAYQLGKYKILGATLDDAIGETFDKIAKVLGLGYPGGLALSNFARQGISKTFLFPKPMKYHNDLNFSFSGLKTFTINLINKNINNIQLLYNIAKEFENTIISMLLHKCKIIFEQTGLSKLIVSGGVSTNQRIIKKLNYMMNKYHGKIFISRLDFCTDNAAMIAYVGSIYVKIKSFNIPNIFIQPRWLISHI